MPLYEYECEACGQRFELIRKFSDPPVEVCSVCGKGPVTRLQSSPAIQFKGSGWYITDYAKKGEGDTKGEGGKGEGGKEAGKTETPASGADTSTKPDTKSDTTTKSESSTSTAAKTGGTTKKA